ncbi:hypothetical protein VSH64_29465 [Amycolatopsis rhabdoformis]|uniref:CidA/LrgA family protein n=1 Tax=Amycolatopsis rhabdoformis TaxID=1448059 RepID=A0ABZ1IL83_9PSEU|nr:hypothetical protein [Amycolatopsis rhabdoformis]WSE35251.1 hypothetical protein VSH64_29465 [Amycolatopsis rhabdoformis]
MLGLLCLDALVLALLEVFFLPLRVGTLGEVPLPLTVLVGAVTTPWLVLTAAKLVRPGLSWPPLVVWVVVVFGVGFLGPGGDLVLVQDWRAILLLGASALPAALVLGGGLGRAASAKGRVRG